MADLWSSSSQLAVAFISVIIGALVVYLLNRGSKVASTLKTKHGSNQLMHLNRTKCVQLKLPPTFALVTDLDHTLIGHTQNETHAECNEHLRQFNEVWCTRYAPKNCVLIYATGRNVHKYELGVSKWDLLKPDILVSMDGVAIHWFNKSLAQQVQCKSTHKIDMRFDDSMDETNFVWYDRSYEEVLSLGWNQDLAKQIHDEVIVDERWASFVMELPPGSKTLEPFRVGLLVRTEKVAIEVNQYYVQRINEHNSAHANEPNFVAMEIHCFWCIERNLDHTDTWWSSFTPARAGKGSAIEFLRKRLHLDHQDMIVMGDSGNDISMLGIDGYNSVVVANASHELLRFYEAKTNGNNNGKLQIMKTIQSKTLGVMEGLEFYGQRLLRMKQIKM